ncbi:MAG: hypothetical protein M1823_000667 [Watsoniomyces obsoletus]|nr:MAG: hypothetical protein M1823_000667 [Watsoniomyces obsoletus]
MEAPDMMDAQFEEVEALFGKPSDMAESAPQLAEALAGQAPDQPDQTVLPPPTPSNFLSSSPTAIADLLNYDFPVSTGQYPGSTTEQTGWPASQTGPGHTTSQNLWSLPPLDTALPPSSLSFPSNPGEPLFVPQSLPEAGYPSQPQPSAAPFLIPDYATQTQSSNPQPFQHVPSSPSPVAPRKPAFKTKPKTNPAKPWIRVNSSTEGKNFRSAKIEAFDPLKVYRSLAQTPPTWNGFEYTNKGELARGATYSVDRIWEYLYRHPLNSSQDGRQRLRLWIQRFPSDSARRFPTATSSRCRFEKCFAASNRVKLGSFRVCFDELSWRNENHDPMINAGYVHLFCLEKLMDLPQLIRDLNFKPENRDLPLEIDGINRMALLQGRVFDMAKNYIAACREQTLPSFLTTMAHGVAEYGHEVKVDGTLTQLLHIVKILDDHPGKTNRTLTRQGKSNPLDHHLGNIILERLETDNRRNGNTRERNDSAPSTESISPATKKRRTDETNKSKMLKGMFAPKKTTARTGSRQPCRASQGASPSPQPSLRSLFSGNPFSGLNSPAIVNSEGRRGFASTDSASPMSTSPN